MLTFFNPIVESRDNFFGEFDLTWYTYCVLNSSLAIDHSKLVLLMLVVEEVFNFL